MSSGKAAASCLQSAAVIRDRCGDSHALASVHDLFSHGEAMQLGVETQWNTLRSGQVPSPHPAFYEVRFHMRHACPG